jgi:hypothetical protein
MKFKTISKSSNTYISESEGSDSKQKVENSNEFITELPYIKPSSLLEDFLKENQQKSIVSS